MTRARHVFSWMSTAIILAAMACSDQPTEPRDRTGPTTLADSIFGIGRTQWFTTDEGGAWLMVPALDEGRVYFERDAGELIALDRTTGALLWHSPFITANNAVIAGNFVGAPWGSLPIFDRVTGQETNHFLYGPTSLSGNAVSDGTNFYVGTHNGHVLGINASTGASVFDTDVGLGHAIAHGTTVSGNLVAVTLAQAGPFLDADSGFVAVVHRNGGALRWRVTLPDTLVNPGITEPPLIVGGLVIVRTWGHAVYALDLFSGAISWSADMSFGQPRTANGGFAACDGHVIVPGGDLGLSSINVTNGSTTWHRSDLGEGSLFNVQCLNGTVIARSGRLRILDAATGADLARYPIIEPFDDVREFFIASATRDETSLYIGTTYGFAKVKAP